MMTIMTWHGMRSDQPAEEKADQNRESCILEKLYLNAFDEGPIGYDGPPQIWNRNRVLTSSSSLLASLSQSRYLRFYISNLHTEYVLYILYTYIHTYPSGGKVQVSLNLAHSPIEMKRYSGNNNMNLLKGFYLREIASSR